jgi:uncharacterized protein
MTKAEEQLRAHLQRELRAALKGHDPVRAGVARGVLSALDNASAVAVPERSSASAALLAGRGNAEVPRRELTEPQIEELLAGEARERQRTRDLLEQHARPEALERVREELELLAGYERSFAQLRVMSPDPSTAGGGSHK